MVPDPASHFIGCCWDAERHPLCSQPRITEGCTPAAPPRAAAGGSPAPSAARPGSATLPPASPPSCALLGPAPTASAQIAAFGSPPPEPSRRRYSNGHLGGSLSEAQRPGQARELCLCHFPRLPASCVEMFRFLLNTPALSPRLPKHASRRLRWTSGLCPEGRRGSGAGPVDQRPVGIFHQLQRRLPPRRQRLRAHSSAARS